MDGNCCVERTVNFGYIGATAENRIRLRSSGTVKRWQRRTTTAVE
ncbi:unnamed protein product [Amoebophrya sp. A25]|nr:unnamed protein product [Amoebophrya sp. A25]|eukprot:GSA25T00005582001.1